MVASFIGIVLLVPPGHLPGESFSDAALQHWPAAHYLRQSLHEYGVLPWWNPGRMLGQPFAANPLNNVWYPPQWLVLVVPPTAHLNTLIYLHMLLLVGGMFLWARRAKFGLPAAVLMSLSLAFNTKLLAHLGAGHLDVFYAMAWAPLLFYAVLKSIQQQTLRAFAALSLICALLTLADLRIAAMVLLTAAGYALLQFVRWQSVRPVVWHVGAAFATYLVLVSVQLVPLMQLSPYLTRSEITPAQAAVYSITPSTFLSGILIGPTAGNHELTVYLGYPVMFLSIYVLASLSSFGRRIKREVIYFSAVMLVAFLWALGDYGFVFIPVTERFPLLAFFRVPSRAWFVAIFALTALAGRGLDHLLARRIPAVGRLLAFASVVAGIVWIAGVLVIVPGVSWLVLLPGISLMLTGSALIILAISRHPLFQRYSLPAASVLILGMIAPVVLQSQPFASFHRQQSDLLAALGNASPCGRTYTTHFDVLDPAFAIADQWSLNGLDPFQLTASVTYIHQAVGYERSEYAIPVPSLLEDNQAPEIDSAMLSAANVEFIISRERLLNPELSLVTSYSSLFLYALTFNQFLECQQHPNVIHARDYVVSYTDDRVDLLIPWVPGWRTDPPGIDIQASETGFISLIGTHSADVTLHYDPVFQKMLAGLAGGMAVLLIGFLLVS